MEARLVLVAHGGASDAHAGQLAGAAVPDLRHAVLAPAVVAEGVPALHRRRPSRGHLAEAALALQQVALACTEAPRQNLCVGALRSMAAVLLLCTFKSSTGRPMGPL